MKRAYHEVGVALAAIVVGLAPCSCWATSTALDVAVEKGTPYAEKQVAQAERCLQPGLSLVLDSYATTANATATEVYLVALNRALTRCPTAVLQSLSQEQAAQLCDTFSVTVVPPMSEEAAERAYRARLSALAAVKGQLALAATRCIRSTESQFVEFRALRKDKFPKERRAHGY